jgi:hypothetical protein
MRIIALSSYLNITNLSMLKNLLQLPEINNVIVYPQQPFIKICQSPYIVCQQAHFPNDHDLQPLINTIK